MARGQRGVKAMLNIGKRAICGQFAVGLSLVGKSLLATEGSEILEQNSEILEQQEMSTNREPSPATTEKFEQAVELHARDNSAAALPLMLQACTEYPFPECALNLASVHHGLDECEGLAYYREYLQGRLNRGEQAEAQESCAELADYCDAQLVQYCSPLPRDELSSVPSEAVLPVPSEAVLPVALPGSPLSLLHEASLSLRAPPSIRAVKTPLVESPNGGPSLDEATAQQVIGSTLVSVGTLAGLASGLAWLELAKSTVERKRICPSPQNTRPSCRGIPEAIDREFKVQKWAIGLGIASGALLTAGTVFWLAEDTFVGWTFSAELQPQMRLEGRF